MEHPSNPSDTTNELPVIDRSAALETAGGDAELVEMLRETCLLETPNIISQAKDAVAKQDWKTARRSSHSLRSSFRVIGAMVAAEAAAQMEMIQENETVPFLRAIEKIELAFQDAVNELNQ